VDADGLRSLLDEARAGAMSTDDAVAVLRALPYTDLGFARVDHHRTLRQGRAEAVYAPHKQPSQIVAIVGELLGASPADGPIIVSRADRTQTEAVLATHGDGVVHGDPDLPAGATIVWRARTATEGAPTVVVAAAGTSDLPVADQCADVLAAHGVHVVRLTDVGVAGIHRILDEVAVLQAATAVVVVAGMEGALASVVGGLTGAPVVAVPTSVGYGSGLEGATALLSMTASCASGITVVGIDNGFGAACAVLRLVHVTTGAAAPASSAPAVGNANNGPTRDPSWPPSDARCLGRSAEPVSDPPAGAG
jgi:NCAIR mutase (PurE)-related protein